MNLTAKVNGTDITKYLKFGGLSFSRNDVDGPTAGRTMDGTMIRDRVAIKQKFNAACRALTEAEVRTLYNSSSPKHSHSRRMLLPGRTRTTPVTRIT